MFSHEKLYNSAILHRKMGFSVIPVRGDADPENPKAAAIKWRDYQRQLPTPLHIHHWFQEQGYGGLAVVCGVISRLAVLDFDDPEFAQAFADAFPHLLHTRTVLSGSRGLPHYYFTISPELNAKSLSVPGADFQYNGKYVVAPPTQIGDHIWTLAHDAKSLELTRGDFRRVMDFLGSSAAPEQKAPANRVSVASRGISGPAQVAAPKHLTRSANPLSPGRISQHYQSRLDRGRNNALFDTACWVRDMGGTAADASTLIETHVHTPPQWPHKPETPVARRREAIATIESAFKQGPRATAPQRNSASQMPNSLREAMLASKLTAVLRVLDACFQHGWLPGHAFTRSDLLAVTGACGIGDWSVRKALSSMAPDDAPLFASATPANAASKTGSDDPTSNAEVSGTKPTQNRGRPATTYLLPDPRALCVRWNVPYTPGDDIGETDLRSAKGYRQAVHERLIDRRPGRYTRDWLAARLGVSVRTLDRYHSQMSVVRTHTFIEKPLALDTLDRVIPSNLDDEPYGVFLRDVSGKRYPPLKPIARRLLRRGKPVWFCVQSMNDYRMPDALPYERPQLVARCNKSIKALPMPPVQHPAVWPNNVAMPALDPPSAAASKALAGAGDEEVAQLLHKQVEALSLVRARDLVMQYGRLAVHDVLYTLKTHQGRVLNPPGFVINLLHARYGKEGLGLDAITMAESLFLTVRHMNKSRSLKFSQAVELVKTYGVEPVRNVLNALYDEAGSVQNPAGYVISRLKRAVSSVQDQDELVTALVAATRERNPERALSRKSAGQLVQQYGEKPVRRLIQVLQTRESIYNPGGFAVVYLRSESRAGA